MIQISSNIYWWIYYILAGVSLVGKNVTSKKREGGIGGRKSLNGISKPSAIQSSKKTFLLNP